MIITGCEENFSPKAEFEEQYVASCVIGINATASSFTATLYLSSTYDVEGFNPGINTVDPAIKGADVTIGYGENNIYPLPEDSSVIYHPLEPEIILWADSNRYNNLYAYYTNPDIPIRTQTLQLQIELPNGRHLSAETDLPRGIFIEYSYDFPHGITSGINQWKFGDAWEITWNTQADKLYFAKFILSYTIEADSATEYKSVEIPLQYVNDGMNEKPVFPGFNYPGKLAYKFEALDKFMAKISEGIEDKKSITVLSASLSITELDTKLSAYYSSINGYLDEYSVRLDEQVYTNINGGLGIFGSYRTTTIEHLFDQQYINSFGYSSNN
jgi:hypothetical protein